MAIRSFIMNGSLYLRWWIGFILVTLVITHIGNKQVKWGDPALGTVSYGRNCISKLKMSCLYHSKVSSIS